MEKKNGEKRDEREREKERERERDRVYYSCFVVQHFVKIACQLVS